MANDLLKNCFVKTGTYNSKIIDGLTVTLKELTIKEHIEFQKKLEKCKDDKTEALYYALKCAMVEPLFFTDEELKVLSSVGEAFIYEAFGELPLIGKSEEEREVYQNQVKEYTEELEKETKTEDEKPLKKKRARENSSLN